MITLQIEMHKIVSGPGFWKLNVSLLKDKDYVDIINARIDEILSQQFRSSRVKLDYLKFIVKSDTVWYSSCKKRSREMEMQLLECKLHRLQCQVVDESVFTKESNLKEIEKVKADINRILEYKAKEAIIRVKTDWFQFGEKSSKYFF